MKKVCIVNIKNNQTFQNISENPTEWINDCIINNYWGKSERWVRAKELMENGNPEEPEHWMWHSEYYEESDIVRTEMRANEKTGEPETMVLLKADYIIEIVDLATDYNYLLNECYENRKREYPALEDLANALFWKEQGDDSKYIDYMKRCEEVKIKYPKPIKE